MRRLENGRDKHSPMLIIEDVEEYQKVDPPPFVSIQFYHYTRIF